MEGERERERLRFTMRKWLTQLSKLPNPQLCSQQAGDLGELMV